MSPNKRRSSSFIASCLASLLVIASLLAATPKATAIVSEDPYVIVYNSDDNATFKVCTGDWPQVRLGEDDCFWWGTLEAPAFSQENNNTFMKYNSHTKEVTVMYERADMCLAVWHVIGGSPTSPWLKSGSSRVLPLPRGTEVTRVVLPIIEKTGPTKYLISKTSPGGDCR